jgi:hypothetical protein
MWTTFAQTAEKTSDSTILQLIGVSRSRNRYRLLRRRHAALTSIKARAVAGHGAA